MPVPQFLQSALWSYDLDKLDAKEDKNMIITQILNCGLLKHLKWMFKNYSNKEIKQVVGSPKRGVWDKRSLNYWMEFFNVNVLSGAIKKAIRNINPDFNYAS